MSEHKPHCEATLPPGWCNTEDAAKYAGVKPRTIRSWRKKGLRYVELNKKVKLTKYEYIDEFLKGFHPEQSADIKLMATEIYNQVVGQN